MNAASHCLVVAGPSGVGKSSLINGALRKNDQWLFSISATTRARRPQETEGREYYFLEEAEFQQRVNAGWFLEYAKVYDHWYGTPASELDRAEQAGKHLLIEVDTVGCLTIRALRPEIPLLAILPPSLAVLKQRLRGRQTEDEATLARRFSEIMAELGRMRGFNYAIVNNDLACAVEQLLTVMALVEQGLHCAAPMVDALLSKLEEPHAT